MIKKIFRLKENELKKVLKQSKPFFSYGITLNKKNNNLGFNRFAIIISGKSVKNSVTRNYFRRFFFNIIDKKLLKNTLSGEDFVFIIKKQIKLDKDNSKTIEEFNNDLKFLIKKIKN